MTPEQFAYWLQGFVELHGSEPTAEQWQQIKDHLQLVFKKETPDRQPGPTIGAPIPGPVPTDLGRIFERQREGVWPLSPYPSYPVVTC